VGACSEFGIDADHVVPRSRGGRSTWETWWRAATVAITAKATALRKKPDSSWPASPAVYAAYVASTDRLIDTATSGGVSTCFIKCFREFSGNSEKLFETGNLF